jgi:hypothetical protein
MSNKQPQNTPPAAPKQEGEPQATAAELEVAQLKAQLAEAEAGKAAAEKAALDAQAQATEALQMAEDAEKKVAATEAAAAEALKKIPDKSEAAEQETLAALRKQKKYVLTINSTERSAGPVPLGVNGVGYLITRDTETLVPEGVINVLNLSVEGNAVQEEQGGQVVTRFQSTKRFSYSYREATADDESKFAGK